MSLELRLIAIMPSHVLYIDDSGTKEYAADPSRYGRGTSANFVFAGLLTTTANAGQLVSRIVQLKYEVFGDENVEMKSSWLRNPNERQKRYLTPYFLTEEELTAFVERYYQTFLQADLVFLASVVNKIDMQTKYPEPWYPPAVAYDALLQRVENELTAPSTFSVVIDDMTGATAVGNQYKANLQKQHGRLKTFGSDLRRGFKYNRLEGRLKFVNSAHYHLVQVADIAAYNVYRQFTDYGEAWEEPGLETLPMYEHFERMNHKFRQGPSGRIQGYGIVKVPIKNRKIWVVT